MKLILPDCTITVGDCNLSTSQVLSYKLVKYTPVVAEPEKGEIRFFYNVQEKQIQ